MINKLLKPEVQKFIRDHENDDPFSLTLKYREVHGLPIRVISEQVAARQKAKAKLPEWYDAESIIFPPLISMEQCSSEATAKYKASLLPVGRLADLTGGAGVDTWYMSQNMEQTCYVEQNAALAEITAHNFAVLHADNIICKNLTAEAFLSQAEYAVDCFYLDPARRDENAKKVFRFSDCTPDVFRLIPLLLRKSKGVMIKASPMLDIDQAIRDLGYVEEVHVVALNNECKEVLYLLNRQGSQDPQIVTVNFRKNGATERFSFFRSEEAAAYPAYSPPLQFLYEPNAAVLKAGAFSTIAEKYRLNKLHQHTHLYTSNKKAKHFPGRCFKITGVTPYSRKAVAPYVPEKKANITVRNFPEEVKDIRKKLKLKDGGSQYLFAFTDMEGQKKIAITHKA